MTELEKLEKELLQEIQEEPGIYENAEEFCTIEPETRTITVPLSKRILGTESDQETNRLYFKCPKVVGDNVDLSLFSLRINYQNAGNKKDQYLVEDVKEEGDNITFSWLLKRNVTAYKGNVKFILCAVKTTEDGIIKNEWNTTLNTECESLEGMEVDKVAVEEETKDIVEQLIAMMNHSAENAVRAVEEAKAEVDKEVGDFALKAQQALADVNNAGQAQTERVQTAGNGAVESVKTAQGTATRAVETAKTEAIKAVQTEGTTQAGNVSAEGEKQVQAVRGAAQEIVEDRGQIQENKTGIAKLKEDIDKLDESVKKKIEPNKTTFFDYVEKTHESANLFNVRNTVVNSDGLTITIRDGNIKCEGVYNLSYNKSIDTGATISLQKGEYDMSAWNGSGEFDVDLVSGSETKRVNCNGAVHTTIKLTSDATYSIKVRCTPAFSSGSCDLMIVKGLSKPLVYEKWFETYSTFSNVSVKKSVLPAYQKFYGKRIVTIGDSIMHGDGNDHYGIGDILAERNGMKLSDYSEGGATISFRQDKASASDEWSKGQNIQYQATKMLANETEKPCVVLINGQTNDINYVSGSEEPQQALGTVTTSYTSFNNENFCGGLEKIFSDIKKVWTDVPIIYIRVHKMMSRKVEWQESYGEKAIQICKKWSVKVVDIYSEGGLNTLIKEHRIYTGNNGDYTHPNREGYDLFYIPMIESAMMDIIN